MMSSPSLPDTDELDTLHSLLGEEFTDIARLFLSDSVTRLRALEHAQQTGDHATLAKISHILCGSAATLGATVLAHHCRALETALKHGHIMQTSTLLMAIKEEHQHVVSRLEKMIHRH